MSKFRSRWTVAVLIVLFMALGLAGGASHRWEVQVNAALEMFRLDHRSATAIAVGLTQLGSAYATLGLALIAVAVLASQKRTRTAVLLFAGTAAERLLADGLKLAFDRPRPKFDLPEVLTTSSSYPSGHSANSMGIYLMIALALAAPRHRSTAVALAVAVSVVAGLTRPYLGVHWPTDVLGGWTLGLIAVWFFLFAGERSGALAFEQQHQIVGGHGAPLEEAEAAR